MNRRASATVILLAALLGAVIQWRQPLLPDSSWLLWIAVHIYYLTGFKNRLLVVIQWAWSYLSFRRGARLIIGKRWRFYDPPRDGAP